MLQTLHTSVKVFQFNDMNRVHHEKYLSHGRRFIFQWKFNKRRSIVGHYYMTSQYINYYHKNSRIKKNHNLKRHTWMIRESTR